MIKLIENVSRVPRQSELCSQRSRGKNGILKRNLCLIYENVSKICDRCQSTFVMKDGALDLSLLRIKKKTFYFVKKCGRWEAPSCEMLVFGGKLWIFVHKSNY